MVAGSRARATAGIDIGPTRSIGVILSADGRELARAVVEHPPSRSSADRVEQDPLLLRSAVREIVARLKAAVEVELVALGLAGEPGALVFLDRTSRPLCPAIGGTDRRAVEEAREVAHRLAEAGLARSPGPRVTASSPAAKILWLAANEPELAQRVAKVLAPADAVRLWLTDELATDVGWASGTGLFDVVARRWSAARSEALAIAPELLPEVFEGSEVTGRVSVAGAAETGLPEGLPVVAGGTTLGCGALAAGLVADGDALVWLDPGAGIVARSEHPPPPAEATVETLCDAIGGWHVLATVPLAVDPLIWSARSLAPEWASAAEAAAVEPEAALLGEAARADPGAAGLLFLPALQADPGGSEAAGAWIGLRAGHGRPELARSVVEGIGYALAERCSAVRRQLALRAPVRLLGRASREEVWRAMLAAQLGLPVAPLAGGFDGARGAAILAGLAVRFWSHPREAVTRAGLSAGPVTPVDPQLQAVYRAGETRRARAAALSAALEE